MEEGAPVEFGDASYVALRQHFICHRRVSNVGYAFAESGLQAFLLTFGIDLVGNVVPYQGAQVAGMIAVAAGGKDLPHIVVDIVNAGYAGGEETSAAHDNVYVFKFNSKVLEGVKNGFGAHLVLLHYVLEL